MSPFIKHKPIIIVVVAASIFTAMLLSLMLTKEIVTAQPQAPQIIGGEESNEGDWPWMAALVEAEKTDAYNGHICGGTLVAPTWVLTAAHCVGGREEPGGGLQIEVVLGRHVLSNDMEGERIGVAEKFVNPFYDSTTTPKKNDIALLRLSRASEQLPIPIYAFSDGELLDLGWSGLDAVATGWGFTAADSENSSDILREVLLSIISNETCDYLTTGGEGIIEEGMLCTDNVEEHKGPCHKDSGGPLMVPTTIGRLGWVQVGIISAVHGGCPGYTVYTRVAHYYGWIMQHICRPPMSGDWIVSQYCLLTNTTTIEGNVIVPDNGMLTIVPNVFLDIDFANHNLLVQDGGTVIVKDGGRID